MRDNHPRIRRANKLKRQKASRKAYDRLLIVSEGEKTEPNYFNELRSKYRLSTASVKILPSSYGTEPIQIVNYAEHLLLNGDPHNKIKAKEFDGVYVVFDRDSHRTYHDALYRCASLDNRYRNDERVKVRFSAIPSVPCFEIWLLLHFCSVDHQIHREDVYSRLRESERLPGYEKSASGLYAELECRLPSAIANAERLLGQYDPYNGCDPITLAHVLVDKLRQLKS